MTVNSQAPHARRGGLDQAARLFIGTIATPQKKVSKLSEAVRVRVDQDQLYTLDAIEAYARGLGIRTVTRSSLVRDALDSYLPPFLEELKIEPRAEGEGTFASSALRAP